MTAQDMIDMADTDGSGLGSITVTPSDGTDLPFAARRLFVQTGGTIKFTGVDGADDTWTVPSNFYIDVAVTRVWATGTAATGIHAIR